MEKQLFRNRVLIHINSVECSGKVIAVNWKVFDTMGEKDLYSRLISSMKEPRKD